MQSSQRIHEGDNARDHPSQERCYKSSLPPPSLPFFSASTREETRRKLIWIYAQKVMWICENRQPDSFLVTSTHSGVVRRALHRRPVFGVRPDVSARASGSRVTRTNARRRCGARAGEGEVHRVRTVLESALTITLPEGKETYNWWFPWD